MHTKLAIILCLYLIIPLVTATSIDPQINSNLQKEDNIDVIILFKDSTFWNNQLSIESELQDELQELKTNLIITQEYSNLQSVAASIDKETFETLRSSKSVQGVYLDKEYFIAPTEETDIQTSVSVPTIGAINAQTTFDVAGRNVTVAVLDTGIDYRHPALGGCAAINTTCRIKGGYDFINNDNNPLDDHGHGTHVAGIIGANSSTLRGVAPQVTFLAYKVCDSQGRCPASSILAGVEAAIENNADIISVSLGGEEQPNNGQSIVSLALNQAVQQGITVVVAAGNSGPSTGCISSPGDALDVITVGNSNDRGTMDTSDDTISPSSCSGPSAFGRLDPDLVAPGTAIISTYLNNNTISFSGTSMATPHVSGAAALLLEYNHTLTPAEIRAKLMHSATNIGDHPFKQGAGLINVSRAINSGLEISIGETDRLEIIVTKGTIAKASLHVENRNAEPKTLTFISTDLTDLEGNSILPSTLFGHEELFIINPKISSGTIINYTIPHNASPGIYGGTIIILADNTTIYRIPVSLTVSMTGNERITGTVDQQRTSCSNTPCGDKIWYAFNQSAAALQFILNWSDSGNNLNFYIYNTSGGFLGSQTNITPTSEQLNLPKGSPYLWILVHSVKLVTNNINFSYNLSINVLNEETVFSYLNPTNNSYQRSAFDLVATIRDPNNLTFVSYNVTNISSDTFFYFEQEELNMETYNLTGLINASHNNITDGNYTLSLKATDRLGNTSTSFISILIDKTTPIINSITQFPTIITPSDNVTIYLNVTDENINISRILLENNITGMWVNATMTQNANNLFEFNISSPNITAQKNIAYQIHAYDYAGNTISSPQRNFTVENNLPALTIISPSNNTLFELGSNVTLTSYASDIDNNNLTYEWIILNQTIARTANTTFQFTQAGKHTITIRIFDGVSTVENTSTILVNDTLSPTVNIIQYPLESHRERDGNTVSLNATFFDYSNISALQLITNQSLIGGCINWTYTIACKWNFTNLTDGTLTFTFNVTDNFEPHHTFTFSNSITIMSCSDTTQNGNEEGVDCGGSCSNSCQSAPSSSSSSSSGGGGGGGGGGSSKNSNTQTTNATVSSVPFTPLLVSQPVPVKKTLNNENTSSAPTVMEDKVKQSTLLTKSDDSSSTEQIPSKQSNLLGFAIIDTIQAQSLNVKIVASLTALGVLGGTIITLRRLRKRKLHYTQYSRK